MVSKSVAIVAFHAWREGEKSECVVEATPVVATVMID